jgi:hypothetical protein
MSDWQLIENPDWAGKQPPDEPFTESACHDHSHFVTIRCGCGAQSHVHETAWRKAPKDHGIASRCKACWTLLEFPPGYFDQSLAEIRKRGWIA